MELFSEVYSCYYQVLRRLLCSPDAVPLQTIYNKICQEGFEESIISIIPKLADGTWPLFQKEGDLFRSKLAPSFLTPLSELEQSYVKALLFDPRIDLFLTDEQLAELNNLLSSVTPLWEPGQFYLFDQFTDGDPYQDAQYRENFQLLLKAQKNRRYTEIDYTSSNGRRVHHYYVPARLEYSVKNDKFRLLALKNAKNQTMRLEILNLSRIQSVQLTERMLPAHICLNTVIRNSYYKEPLRLHIKNKRNALERAMLHFANYEKNTTRLSEDTYECLIYYNQAMETELLIEVMSFGPMLTVIGSEAFQNKLKDRLKKQKELFCSTRV